VDTLDAMRSHGYDLTTPEAFKLHAAKAFNTSATQIPETMGRVIAMIMPSLLSVLSHRRDILERHFQEDNESYSARPSQFKLELIISKLPASRCWNDEALIQKSANYDPRYNDAPYTATFMEVTRATRDRLRLDGPSLYETTVIHLPNGVEMVVPRKEILNAIIASRDSIIPLNPLKWAPSALGALAALLPTPSFSQDEANPLPISHHNLLRLPGVRGKLIKRGSLQTSGLLTKLAIDYCLGGCYSCGEEILKLYNVPYDEFMNKLGHIVVNKYKKLLCNI